MHIFNYSKILDISLKFRIFISNWFVQRTPWRIVPERGIPEHSYRDQFPGYRDPFAEAKCKPKLRSTYPTQTRPNLSQHNVRTHTSDGTHRSGTHCPRGRKIHGIGNHRHSVYGHIDQGHIDQGHIVPSPSKLILESVGGWRWDEPWTFSFSINRI